MRGTDLLNKITSIRRDQEQTIQYVFGQDEKLGFKLIGCGTWLHFREWSDHGGEARLLNANFCKRHTLCRTCSARRAVRLVEAYQGRVEERLLGEPALIPAMVSLTVKSGFDALERILHLKSSWAKMLAARRKGESESGRHALIEWNHVAGSLRAIEVTKGDAGWHVHAHCYALLRGYIDKFKLSEEWQRFTGDSMICDVRQCYGEPREALHEVIKYAAKFSDLSDPELWDFHQAVKGSRMFDCGGILRGTMEGDIDQDDITGLDGPHSDWVATWLWMAKKYHLQEGPPSFVPVNRRASRPMPQEPSQKLASGPEAVVPY